MSASMICRATVLALGALAVASCEPADGDPGPGGVSVGEARALDEAAEMIEQRRIPDEYFESEGQGEEGTAETSAPASPDS